jgi:DNA-binding MarR family transcriptional regulator
MRKINIWDDEINQEIEELQQALDKNLTKAIAAVALTIFCNPRLTKKEIREKSGVRKQRLSHLLIKFYEMGYLDREGRGVKRDAFRYSWNE